MANNTHNHNNDIKEFDPLTLSQNNSDIPSEEAADRGGSFNYEQSGSDYSCEKIQQCSSSGALAVKYPSFTSNKNVLNGFLSMHARTGLLKSYKSKWFVYSDDTGKLFYYKSRGDLIPEGEISIVHATFSFDAKEKPGVFEIRVTPSHSYILEAADREEMFTWLQELQTRRRQIVKRLHQQNKPKQLRDEERRISDDFVTVEADEIPKITVPESANNRTEKVSAAAISKLSNNVSKAADSAKQKLSSMFQRKSQNMELGSSSVVCTNCRMLEAEMLEAREETRGAKEELAANQQVLRLLHNNMDLLQQEIATLESVKKIYQDPDIAAEFERQKEHGKLLHRISELQKENEKLSAHNQDLIIEVAEIKECQQMMQETIQAKDNVIMALSSQIENMQKDINPSHLPVSDDIIDFAEPYHDSLKTKLEAFELQNKFLNKEILELHTVMQEETRKWEELNEAHMKLEAEFHQLQSKHLYVISEVNKPLMENSGQVNTDDDVMSTLIQEAMQLEASRAGAKETLTASLRVKKHDSYGFELESSSDNYEPGSYQSSRIQQSESAEAVSLRVKWENFITLISNSDYKIQRTQEFKKLVRGGIPKEYRERIWNILIGFHVGELKGKTTDQYYDKLLKKCSKTSNPFGKQIEIDLRRTLPNNKYFEDDESEGIPKLRNVLQAYSFHNPTVGYCQGMNRVAAFALLFLKEEDAFWCLVAIIDFIMPPDYFSKTMITAQADQRVLREVLVDKVPRVVNHLDALEMDISLFSFNWFITLFIENIPIPMVLRIWDVFLFEGIKVLFRFATAFFKYAEERILKHTDYITANQYLRDFGTTLTDVERICYIAFTSINPFPIRSIHNKRAAHLEQVKNELRALNAMREELRGQRLHNDYNSDFDTEEDDGGEEMPTANTNTN